jgi:hypothetical protein
MAAGEPLARKLPGSGRPAVAHAAHPAGEGALQQIPALTEAERLLGDCRPPHPRTRSHGRTISVRGSRAEPARGLTGLH